MFITTRFRVCNTCVVRLLCRSIHTSNNYFNNALVTNNKEFEQSLSALIQKYQKKIIYNTFIYKGYPQLSYNKNLAARKIALVEKRQRRELASIEPLPISLKYALDNVEINNTDTQDLEVVKDENLIHFPYGQPNASSFKADDENTMQIAVENEADVAENEVKMRHDILKQGNFNNWMTEYDNFDEASSENEASDRWDVNYGTPDPHSHISNVPCGGCGALLHCKDTSIPGYIPSEIYKNSFRREGNDLQSVICQRCHFLKNYNVALQVRVAHEDYPKVLETIQKKYALIILMVDLLDFPCSIWPGIADVLGSKKPIVVVGNKVDLLPRDSNKYLERMQILLKETVLDAVSNKSAANIKHVCLISAKTGWGVEELINKLHNLWNYKGDVYLVGSTNVGKSSLFNCLLQSDYCKIQAVDLVQRATTSVWPGTTLNLLKFPILRPSGWRLYARTKRLQSLNKLMVAENKLKHVQLRDTRKPEYATLIGRIDRTFSGDAPMDSVDPFSVSGSPNSDGQIRLGVDESNSVYATSKWCYDTPGVVQDTQIIHLLTTEELTLTLPRNLIQPKSFNVRIGQTIFIAGIGRVDYITGPEKIKLTVFCAHTLPITMCNTEDARILYDEFLGTDVFLVPKGSKDRLKQWPDLKMSAPIKFLAKDKYTSSGDIVLSSAGWIAVTSESLSETVFNAWTPEGRGIYSRKSLLPYAVNLKGVKIWKTPLFIHNNVYVPIK